ncbi:hypothetical protein [Teredinibacter purpureus]|uniref:hypothetical protein n=1 Tax=Teredinibacter purpureus TaxID=2731756 RepID=UPI0005F85724|nr:hypothetical protein [Teredinibacter purpureus]
MTLSFGNKSKNISVFLFLSLNIFRVEAIDVCAGENISFEGVSWKAQNLNTDNTVDDLRTIAISNYVVVDEPQTTIETGTLTPLTLLEGGRSSSDMSFYFSKSGRYRITVTDQMGIEESYLYDVKIPTHTLTNRAVDGFNIVPDTDNDPELEFGGGIGGAAGVKIRYSVTMGDCAGTIGDAQLVNFKDIDGEDSSKQITSTAGDYVLDFDSDEDNSWFYNFSRESDAGDQFNRSFEDSPSNPLDDDYLCVSSEAYYRYYLFYKSNKRDDQDNPIPTVWVPFAQLFWNIDPMFANRDSTNDNWFGHDNVRHGGNHAVPNNLSSQITVWPEWTTYQSNFNPVNSQEDCANIP